MAGYSHRQRFGAVVAGAAPATTVVLASVRRHFPLLFAVAAITAVATAVAAVDGCCYRPLLFSVATVAATATAMVGSLWAATAARFSLRWQRSRRWQRRCRRWRAAAIARFAVWWRCSRRR